MKTRRDFLVTVGCAVGAATVLAMPSAGAAASKAMPAQAGPRTAAEMQRWLLSTGKGQLHPRLAEYVAQQIG